jgi:hypothetical protein
LSDRQRRENQNVAAFGCDLLRPVQLLNGLPKPAVLKERSAATAHGPSNYIVLELKSVLRNRHRFKASRLRDDGFRCDELFVGHWKLKINRRQDSVNASVAGIAHPHPTRRRGIIVQAHGGG